MARILRGEFRWADLNPIRGREQAGLRPVLILSHDRNLTPAVWVVGLVAANVRIMRRLFCG